MSKSAPGTFDSMPVQKARGIDPPAPGYSGLLAIWTLYVLTVRQHLHGRRWLVMAILFSLPVGLTILIRATADELPAKVTEMMIAFLLFPQALLPILALTYAAGIIRDEQEEQTLTYLLIRPIPRWAIFTVKMLATLSTTATLTTLFTVLTFVAIYIGSDVPFDEASVRCLKTIVLHNLAVIAYCCLFGLVSLMTNWTLIAGILYTVLVEGLVANLPFGIRSITVIYYCRTIAYQWMDFKVTNHGHTEDLAADVWQIDPKTVGDMPSIQTCVTVLLVASLVFTVIGSLMCARREFHVKTPETGG
jgi:ABC-2 type transport system permease protein